MNKPINICTFGHNGHGKTSLMSAISQVLYRQRQCQVRYNYDDIKNPPEKLETDK